MVTVKINFVFLLRFTRTTSSELIRWYDEICRRRLVRSNGETFSQPFRIAEISLTHKEVPSNAEI